jgi:hypothetical protein
MPANAIQAGCVDFVLSPRQIAAQLLRPQLRNKPMQVQERDHLGEIMELLFQSNGVDFSQYKLSTLERRIARH